MVETLAVYRRLIGARIRSQYQYRASFALFSVAEVLYMTYHLDWTVFLFAHTLAEVADLAAFILIFVGAVQPLLVRTQARRPVQA